MSYLALTDVPPPYQTSAARDTHLLAALEDACAPYLRAGYKITSHNSDSFVLVRDRPPVNIVAVILLMIFPLLAVIYVVSARNRRDEVACIRVNSRGQVEESGDTLAALRAARAASRRSALVALVIILVLVSSLAAYVFGGALYSRIVGGNSGDDVAASGSTRASAATANDSILVVPPSSGGVATKRAKQRSKAADAYHPYVADPYPADDVPDSIGAS